MIYTYVYICIYVKMAFHWNNRSKFHCHRWGGQLLAFGEDQGWWVPCNSPNDYLERKNKSPACETFKSLTKNSRWWKSLLKIWNLISFYKYKHIALFSTLLYMQNVPRQLHYWRETSPTGILPIVTCLKKKSHLIFRCIVNVLHLSSPLLMLASFDITSVNGWFSTCILSLFLPVSFLICNFLVYNCGFFFFLTA